MHHRPEDSTSSAINFYDCPLNIAEDLALFEAQLPVGNEELTELEEEVQGWFCCVLCILVFMFVFNIYYVCELLPN